MGNLRFYPLTGSSFRQRSGLVTFLGNLWKMIEVPGWKGALLRNKTEKLEQVFLEGTHLV